jgi:N-acetylmuramoyl-L-alanine amidase
MNYKLLIKNNYLHFIIYLALLLTCFFTPNSSFGASKKNNITYISVKNYKDKTEIRFKLNKAPEYRVFTIGKPDRLVLDFKNTNISANKSVFANSKMFKAIRTNLDSQGQLRLVLDLNYKIAIYKSSIIMPGKRNSSYYLSVILTKYKKSSAKQRTPLRQDPIIKLLDKETGEIKYSNKKIIKKPVIVIDAGHGGKDPGAIGKYIRNKEKYITLSYAKELKRHLDRTKKYRVFLTRKSDYYITLGGRVEKSRKLKADLFISLHADSSPNHKTSGLSIYTLSEKSSDKQAERLARKENKSDIIGGADFSAATDDILKTLINMSQRSTMNDSAKFAEIAIKTLKINKVNILQNTHRFAGFRVLTAPDVPSVLIELGYLSNRYEEKVLSGSSHKKQVSEALVKAIDEYFSSVK